MDVREIVEKMVEICFDEFCMVAGDSPYGCYACPYGQQGSNNGGCYLEYEKYKMEKLRSELPNLKLEEIELSFGDRKDGDGNG